MAKQYVLVGSVRDRFDKVNRFKEEEIIKIPEVNFKSIVDVDRFTSKITSFDLLNTITKGYKSKDTISIKIFYNKEDYYYEPVIFNNSELYELLKSVDKTKDKRNGQYRDKFVITNPNKYFNDNFNELIKLLDENAEMKLDYIFAKNKDFYGLINNYLKRDRFEDASRLIEEIKKCFKDYEVFRAFIIRKNKNYTYTNCDVAQSNLSKIKSKPVVVGTKTGNFSLNLHTDIDDDYEPDDFELLSPEEKLKAYGEGNEDIEEYRRRH